MFSFHFDECFGGNKKSKKAAFSCIVIEQKIVKSSIFVYCDWRKNQKKQRFRVL